MAFVNLPANFQDIFYSITDRVSKLETGPNEAMYEAEYAQEVGYSAQQMALVSQSVATEAQVQAINAQIAANQAASQATIAQSQATIASSQATAAQVSANGKNKVYYSTGAPGTTANTAGDIWYQYGTTGVNANKVIAQWTGAGSNSWTSVIVSGLVLANLDAGSITTGTLSAIQISAGSGGTMFTVSPSGVMAAQGAWIKGNITADSGTFNGAINATSGFFGDNINKWSIGPGGITGVGTAEITGGRINGSSITIGANFSVSTAGIMTCSGAIVNGTLAAGAGSTMGGFTIGASNIQAGSSLDIQSSGTIIGGNSSTLFYGFANIGGGTAGSERLIVKGNSSFDGTIVTTGAVTINGELRAVFGYNNPVSSAANVFITTTGQIRRTTASSARYKHDIVDLTAVPELDPTALYELPVRAFRYNEDQLLDTDDRAGMLIPGFIAEEVDAIYPIAADYSEGAESWNDRMIIPAMLALIQEQNARIKALEVDQ